MITMLPPDSPDDEGRRQPRGPSDGVEYYEQLQERWPADRPSRKRQRRTKRAYQRRQERRIHVRADRLDPPDTARLSRALLAAQRELAQAQAEADARSQAAEEAPDDAEEADQ